MTRTTEIGSFEEKSLSVSGVLAFNCPRTLRTLLSNVGPCRMERVLWDGAKDMSERKGRQEYRFREGDVYYYYG